MKHLRFLSLVFLVLLITLNESLAECVDDQGYSLTCRSGIDSAGKNEKGEYICGTDCTFTIEGSTVKVKANSENATIDNGIFSSFYYQGGKIVTTSGEEVNFNKIELDGDFKYIGKYAFANSGATVTSTSGVLNINNSAYKIAKGNTKIEADVYIASNAAAGQTFQDAKIKGDLIFADGVTSIANWFMGYSIIDGNVVIPDSVTNIASDNWITIADSLSAGNKIYCNDCYDLFYESCYKDQREGFLSDCLNALDRLKNSGQIAAYPYGCKMFPFDKKCMECKSPDYKLDYGYCYRVRYTLPEADELTSDDNENMIEWIFE
ncbi:MAG: hypothetical protein IJ564_07095 [Alphaproteobacteria bacterium]|nr:hypothetical protein [Alphaproteobacteria bacterium]